MSTLTADAPLAMLQPAGPPLGDRVAPSFSIAPHGHQLNVADTRVARAAATEFCSGFEEGTLQFFDAVLPECRRMFDFGAFIGFTSLYAAAAGAEVFSFEPSPTNHALLAANVAANPALAPRIYLHPFALGAADATLPLFGKGHADADTSLYRDVQRTTMVRCHAEATVPVRAAANVLQEVGLDGETLLKIDIEGAEYDVVPAIAGLLARHRPFLHISFHPYNIVLGTDEYLNQVVRLRRALAVAEAVAPYRHMYFHTEQGWTRIDRRDRMSLFTQYLLKPKPMPRIATPQYGFTDALALSEVALPLG